MARQLPTYDPFKISSVDPLGLGLRIIGNNYDPLEDYNKVIQGQAEAAVNQEKIDGLRRADEIEKKIAESAKSGAGYEDILAQVEKEYLNSGDIDTAMKAAKMRESLAGDPMEEAKRLAGLYKSAQEISAIDPAQGLSVLNSYRERLGQQPLANIPAQFDITYNSDYGYVKEYKDGSGRIEPIKGFGPINKEAAEKKNYLSLGKDIFDRQNSITALKGFDDNTLRAELSKLSPEDQQFVASMIPKARSMIIETGRAPKRRFITTREAEALGYGPKKIGDMKQQGIIRDGF